VKVKYQIQWLALVLVFAMGVAGSMGCATMAASEYVNNGDREFYYTPVLADEIVAIGRPDAVLVKELEQPNAVAFIGLKNTYLLHKGGEELQRIAQLKLEGKRMDIDAARSYKLYLKDKQVWGELVLTYGGGLPIAADEVAELEKGGFIPLPSTKNIRYQKKLNIEGVVYPAIKLSEEQISKLGMHRAFNLYNPRDAKPPVMGKILKAPLIAVGVAADIALIPVYAVGLGVTVLILSSGSH
jgi:hypothetical protein